MKDEEKPIANPYVMLREEFDDWAVLFNPDAGLGYAGFGLNPTGVYLWKLLDGEHTLDALVEEIRNHVDNVPEDASHHVRVFVDALVTEGLATYGSIGLAGKNLPAFPVRDQTKWTRPSTYEAPQLVNLSGGQAALGDCTDHGSSGDCCEYGASARYCNGGACLNSGCSCGNYDYSMGGCPCPDCSDGMYVASNCGSGSTLDGGNCWRFSCWAGCTQ